MTDVNNIGQQGGGIPEDMLKAYMEGRLPAEQQREVEARLAEEGMESDALEGLQEISLQESEAIASRINHKLQHELRTKKYRNKKLFTDNKWNWMAVLIVLLLCVLGFVVVKIFVG